MYVREKTIKRGIGTWDSPLKLYRYWQLVDSHRVEGKVRQRVVAHIGPVGGRLPDKEVAAMTAKGAGLLCGADGCGREAVEPLTWTSPSGNTDPVTFTTKHFGRCGARVCAEHLEEWHDGQRGGPSPKWRVMPLIYPDGLPDLS